MMKFNFRKIAATVASVAMMGSTIGLAAAANYPAPFVKNGVADVGFVYGSTAANSDLIASVDIANNLQTYVTSGSGGSIEGESFALWTSSTKLYLNDSINKAKTIVSRTNLPTVLADGSFQGTVTSTYTQKVDIGSTVGTDNRLAFGLHPTSDDDPTYAFDLGTVSGNAVFNYTLTFNKEPNLTHTDSEGEQITILGREYTIGSETDNTNLILLESAASVNLDSETTPSAVLNVGGKSYTVELVSASDTSATVRLTDDATGKSDTKEINEDTSKTILGLEVAVTTADETNFKLSATVSIGSNKLKLTDNAAVKRGSDEETVDGTNVRFDRSGVLKAGTFNLTKIVVQMTAEDSDVDAILPGGEFIDPVFGALKLTFPQLSQPIDSTTSREDIIVKNSGSDKMTVTFQSWDATAPKSIDWYYNKTDSLRADGLTTKGYSSLADSGGDAINVFERMQINKSEYVVVGNEDSGGIWELKVVQNDTSTATNSDITFQNVMTGLKVDAVITADGTGSIDLGSQTFTVDYIDNRDTDGDESVRIRYQDGSRTTAGNAVIYPTIQTLHGARLAFYEPVMITFNNWDGSGAMGGANLSVLKFPDGDGFTSFTTTINADASISGGNSSWVFNSKAINLSDADGAAGTLALASLYANVGQLTYNITRAKNVLGYTNANHNNTAVIQLMGADNATVTNQAIVIFEEQDDSSSQLYEAIIVRIEGSGTTASSLGVSDVERTWGLDAEFDEIQVQSDTDLYKSVDFWGTVITTDQSDTDSYTATISYPDEQVYAELYFAEASATTSGTGDVMTISNFIVKDNEASGVTSKNLVVVGGSCVNTVAASLLGSQTPMCGAAFTGSSGVGSGQYLIQTFDGLSSGKVATLVAGYEAGDTVNAATYFRTQSPLTDVGTKYIGTTTTSASLQTSTA